MDAAQNPYQGLSMLAQATAQMNELFLSLTASGFTEKQALYLVSRTMVFNMDERDGED